MQNMNINNNNNNMNDNNNKAQAPHNPGMQQQPQQQQQQPQARERWRDKIIHDPVAAAQDAAKIAADLAGNLRKKNPDKPAANEPPPRAPKNEQPGQPKEDPAGKNPEPGKQAKAARVKEVTDEELWQGLSFFVGAGLKGEQVVDAAMQDATFDEKYIGASENRCVFTFYGYIYIYIYI
jgi:hypothetical protein